MIANNLLRIDILISPTLCDNAAKDGAPPFGKRWGTRLGRAQIVIYLYGDDSADEKRQRVSSVAAVIGTEDMWQSVEEKWIDRCNCIPFHAKDCESDQGDYANPKNKNDIHRANKELYRDLTTIVVESGLGGIGVAIDLVAQNKVFPQATEGLAYYKSFVELLETVKRFGVMYNETVKCTFDISTENKYNAAQVYEGGRKHDPLWSKHFYSEISFAPAKQYPRLQVGDLLAYESMKALDHTVGPIKRKRGSWEALRATGRFETISYSEQWFTDLKKHLPEVERKVGFNQTDYENWLKDTGRHHNMSNLIEFSWKVTPKDEK